MGMIFVKRENYNKYLYIKNEDIFQRLLKWHKLFALKATTILIPILV